MRLIDADAFRRELDNHWPFTRDEQSKHGMADMAKSTVLTVLNKMPTIEEHKWIPCSERLPEKPVLCCSKVGTMIIGLPVPNTMMSVTGYNADGDVCLMPNCVAWMPLPEPYRAERREE